MFRYHSAAVTKCGRLYTWGHGKSGRLGHGDEVTCMLPTRVEGLAHQTVTEVATAESHTVALTSNGAVFSWGRDRFGQVRDCCVARISPPSCTFHIGRPHPLCLALAPTGLVLHTLWNRCSAACAHTYLRVLSVHPMPAVADDSWAMDQDRTGGMLQSASRV